MSDIDIPILESIYDSQGRNDAIITLLVELCHLLSACLRRDQLMSTVSVDTTPTEAQADTIDVPLQIDPYAQLGKTLAKLAKRPGHDGTVLIRARRMASRSKADSKPDYQIDFSDIALNRHGVAAMVCRVGSHMSYLNALVLKAFQTLSDYKIHSLFLRIPDIQQTTLEDLKRSLRIIARYQPALANAEEIHLVTGDRLIATPIMKDERSRPDPNLTLLAGLNNIAAATMDALVSEVHNWIKVSDTSTGAHRYASVYDAITGIRNLRGKFRVPPIELNNIRWLLADRKAGKLSKAKAQLAWLLREAFDGEEWHQILSLESLYDADYGLIAPRELGMRMKRLSDIIDAIGDRPKGTMIVEEVVTHLQWHLDRVADDVIGQLGLDNGVLFVKCGDRPDLAIGRLNDLVVRIIEFYTGRLGTRKKMRQLGADGIEFNRFDYEILSRDFDLSPLDVKEIIRRIKKCFDARGRFDRAGFESCVPSFARYEGKVFEILWYFLKQPMPREDRIAFVNALQLLFVKMKRQAVAVQVLLNDFLDDPGSVYYHDRNGIMLANLLLRRYNKELEIDIEITPEEVFLVREGLDREVATAALMVIDQRLEDFFEKIRSIHRGFIASLGKAKPDEGELEAKYLLSLEREIHIFVSLLGGDIARSVLRSALNEYGSPDSEIYHMHSAAGIFETLLLHLKVILRGLGRAGDANDEWILAQVADRREEFIALCPAERHIVLVERVLEGADHARQSLHERHLTEVA